MRTVTKCGWCGIAYERLFNQFLSLWETEPLSKAAVPQTHQSSSEEHVFVKKQTQSLNWLCIHKKYDITSCIHPFYLWKADQHQTNHSSCKFVCTCVKLHKNHFKMTFIQTFFPRGECVTLQYTNKRGRTCRHCLRKFRCPHDHVKNSIRQQNWTHQHIPTNVV